MVHKTLPLMMWVFTAVTVLVPPTAVTAEQVGTTPEGNVVYQFTCPSATHPKDVDIKIDWKNHLGDHPEWDIQSGMGTAHTGSQTDAIAEWWKKERQGQVLKCFYGVKILGRSRGGFYYKYKVKRDIISCQSTGKGWKCVLKAQGDGGKGPG